MPRLSAHMLIMFFTQRLNFSDNINAENFYNIINNLNRSSIDNFDLVLSIDATAHILYITHMVTRLCHRNKCVAGICSLPEPGGVVDHH